MNQDEELYRLMNEEDDLYMGDKEKENSDEKSSDLNSNKSGCVGIFICLIISVIVILRTTIM